MQGSNHGTKVDGKRFKDGSDFDETRLDVFYGPLRHSKKGVYVGVQTVIQSAYVPKRGSPDEESDHDDNDKNNVTPGRRRFFAVEVFAEWTRHGFIPFGEKKS
jgi:hypothetical protein